MNYYCVIFNKNDQTWHIQINIITDSSIQEFPNSIYVCVGNVNIVLAFKDGHERIVKYCQEKNIPVST